GRCLGDGTLILYFFTMRQKSQILKLRPQETARGSGVEKDREVKQENGDIGSVHAAALPLCLLTPLPLTHCFFLFTFHFSLRYNPGRQPGGAG
ncbi:MAG TPA: hypothetical protein PK919_01045, partial [Candidatus Aminicenantes bacterium]|nr:hypothetical protein [Candidatus Aminicenantes bacterium]